MKGGWVLEANSAPAAQPTAAVRAAPLTMTPKQAQEKLNAPGIPVGTADGMMGPKTRSEQLMHFQESRALPETGMLDTATIAALNQ